MLKIINKRNVGIHPLNCRKNFTNKHNSKAMDKATALVVPLGTVQKVENVEAGIFDLSYIIGDYEYADSAFMALESTVIAHGFSGMFKGITKRERPGLTDNPYRFHFFDRKYQNLKDFSSAMPSGDVTTAFSWASVVAERSDSAAVSVICYGLAGMVAVERVYYNSHWISDVWVGAVIGTAVGKAVVKFNQPNSAKNLLLVPVANNDFSGIMLQMRF